MVEEQAPLLVLRMLQRIISNLWEIPVPLTPRVASEFRIGSRTLTFASPNYSDNLPALNVDTRRR